MICLIPCSAENQKNLGNQKLEYEKLYKDQLIKKLDKLVADNDGVLTEKLLITSIYNDFFTVNELICYLELQPSKNDTTSIFNRFVYIYLGRNDHQKALFYYYRDVSNVEVKYLKNRGLVFPDQKEDNYAIHQKAILLNCIFLGWYDSDEKENNDISIKSYIDELSNNFNNIITYKDVVEGANKHNGLYSKIKRGQIGLDPMFPEKKKSKRVDPRTDPGPTPLLFQNASYNLMYLTNCSFSASFNRNRRCITRETT